MSLPGRKTAGRQSCHSVISFSPFNTSQVQKVKIKLYKILAYFFPYEKDALVREFIPTFEAPHLSLLM